MHGAQMAKDETKIYDRMAADLPQLAKRHDALTESNREARTSTTAQSKEVEFKFKFGDQVHCVAILGAKAFDGVVTFCGINGNNEPYFHVRDEFGQYFHRSTREIVRQDGGSR